MSKVIAINGSPRKNGNTAALLQRALEGAASVGAETELVHLVDLCYKGCVSCFACKRKGAKNPNRCAMQDDLSPILEGAMRSDVIICGSPIYLGDVTSLMRGFIERLGFINVSYSRKDNNNFKGKPKNCAFFYTMNAPKPMHLLFAAAYLYNTGMLRRFGGKTKQLVSADTWQFDDYSKYDASNFGIEKKKKARDTVFPKDCQKAYDIGRRLAFIKEGK
ncbi:MAG: flavodoxin family protein [Oscillospiraceae bacterium]|jgi:multimeric flavodoxin WrbA|nr:flavodoxin family protein [Oscillospiraceae bacterium]